MLQPIWRIKKNFFLSDSICIHSPYTFSSMNIGQTNYINWDRFNVHLPIHFYSHEKILNKDYDCKRKFAILVESETIVPKLYQECLNKENVIRKYDGVFTHSERLIDKYKNAFFIPGSSVWYGGSMGGGNLDPEAFKKKTKGISFVSSDKAQCRLHEYRLSLANYFIDRNNVDVMGTINGGNHIQIADSLRDYRYSIIIENNITSCYFTEKILNCFASMTIPIYIGAREIGRFFNEDSIISLSPNMNLEQVEEILATCTREYYERKITAIIDNYNRVLEYNCIEDYIYKHYNGPRESDQG